jgi:protein O-GlcNAc transferase
VFRRALAIMQQGNAAAAEQLFKRVLQIQPRHIAALNLLSVLLVQLGRFEEAEIYSRRALAEDATSDATFSNYGLILKALKRPAEALQQFSRALQIDASFAQTWNNRGTAFADLKRYSEAIGDFDRAIAIKPDFSEAFYNKGNALASLQSFQQALAAYNEALRLNPDLAQAWLGCGNVALALGNSADALAAYERALALRVDLAEAWLGRGTALAKLRRYEEAIAAYGKAMTMKPDLNYVASHRLHTKLAACDWTNLAAEIEDFLTTVRTGRLLSDPFNMLAIPSTAAEQLSCARGHMADQPTFAPLWRGEVPAHDRIRVAYLSADFNEHPVGHLIVGLFEHHDKSQFEITGISLSADPASAIRQRIMAAAENFMDVGDQSDQCIAEQIRQLEIDILVDLHGFTAANRNGVLARRVAPIQVNFLGYAGTLGSGSADYIVADPTVIPREHFRFYGESVAWLPESFMPNDAAKPIGARTPSRSDLNLPERGFVFCCFNQAYKINPTMFDVWMRLLAKIPGSVLWLREDDAVALRNLRLEAERRGVAGHRLVFAERTPLLADHLARLRQADLFLDTSPYNAHAAACDALWAGVPVLTQIGETFAGRVAASLLRAVDLPELITSTPQAYEHLATELATSPEKSGAIREKLARNRLTAPLFDTRLFARRIEAAYTAMYQRCRAGLRPEHIDLSG